MGVFAMPSLGADMEDGTLVEWLVEPGARVARGDVVAVIETQKGAIEIEVFEDGTVEQLLAGPGERLPVGTPLAVIDGAGGHEAPAGAPARPSHGPAAEAPGAGSPAPAEPDGATAAGGAPPSSPAARARAREVGLDLGSIPGTGPGGAVRLGDVEAVIAGAPRPVRPKPGLDPEAMRAAIGAAMARSKREIPHYAVTHDIEIETAARWLAAVNAERAPAERLLMGALLVRATVLAAGKTRAMNGEFAQGAFRPSEAVHAGVVVALRGGGLIAPAIRDAQGLDLEATMAAMRDLVARARTGRLKGSEMTGATITVSSLGETGAEAMTGIIYPPQVALVAFGAPSRRPRVVGERVVPRIAVTATLSADHRVSDGREGARFLAGIDRRLQSPETL